jgi:hypothetical protein
MPLTSRKAALAKRKGRSELDVQEKTPGSSGRSVGSNVDLYEGEALFVAFSNSSMLDKPQFKKFFKSSGCTEVDTVKEGECNLLW